MRVFAFPPKLCLDECSYAAALDAPFKTTVVPTNAAANSPADTNSHKTAICSAILPTYRTTDAATFVPTALPPIEPAYAESIFTAACTSVLPTN